MPLSTAALKAILGIEGSDPVLTLVTIVIGTGGDQVTLRFVNNSVDIVSNGQTFTAYPFQLGVTDGDRSPEIKVRIGNVDRQIILAILDERIPPVLRVDFVLESTPNTLERTFQQFTLRDVQADTLLIEGSLGQSRISTEIWPSTRANKSRCPSLFR